MALTAKRLDTRAFGTGAVATHYTAPGSTKCRVTEIWICNNSGASRTVRMHLVPSGGSAATSNALMYDFAVPPGVPMPIPCNTWMNTGDFIQGNASGADVSCTISGVEET